MHMPWSSSAWREVDDTDDGLLHRLALTFEVLSQYLDQLWSCLGLCPRDLRHRNRGSDPGEIEQFASDDFHIPPSFDLSAISTMPRRACKA